ncbi:MAG TPA: MerR family transcriptional regulator [Thermoanaerobaculia bacterium]|nr:MerR family transcriptional regulator [Thermoanaerobaculia bacterium]
MSKKDRKGKESGELLTLTEVSKRTGISMPTLQRYKKEYQDRIPSKGRGRKQRYPVAALKVFEELKAENIKRRGRPRRDGSPAGSGPRRRTKAPRPAAKGGGGDLLTLTEISKRTGISYPTLVRYVKLRGDEIPSEGEGRRRRYHPAAVEIFRTMRQQSSRGRKPKGAAGRKAVASSAGAAAGGAGDGKLAQRVASLERTQERLERQIQEMIQLVRKPITVTVQRAK